MWLPVESLAPVRDARGLRALEERLRSPRELTLLYAVHLFGGAAMGGGAGAVCDEQGRVRGVSGLYVSDASALPSNTGVNPQVTIMANALRIAAGMAP